MSIFTTLSDYFDATFVLVFITAFLLVYVYMSLPRSPLPGPFALPLIGNIQLFPIIRQGDRSHLFDSCKKKYGNVFRLYLGPYLMVVLCGYDNIHKAFVKNADKFSDRPNWLPDIKKRREETGGGGFLWENGDEWKKMRRFALQTMRDFGVGKRSLEEVILDEAENISAIFGSCEGQPIDDVKHRMTASISNVIHHVIFGFRYSHEDAKFKEILEALDVLFKAPGFLLNSLIPKWVDKFWKQRSLREAKRKFLFKYVHHQIEEHQQTYDDNNIRDFVDLYIQTQKADGSNKINALFRVILELFTAGSETTGTSLDWALLYMIGYPDVQQRCYEDIQKTVGSGRQVKMSDRSNLPYIEATLLEVQRISNIAGSSLPHTCTEDSIIDGHVIPKGAIVFGFLKSAHHDPKYWHDSCHFRPERFIDKSTGYVMKDEHLIPFSIGPRICPGESLAKMEMFLVFTNLLQKYQFSKFSDSDVISFEGTTGITTCARPYRLKVKTRQ